MLTDNSLPNMMIQSKTNNHLSIINNHLAFAPLHLSRTLYKSTLFMQNKPNFQKSQMNVSIYLQMAYENKHNWTLSENKPNQTQFQKGGLHGYMFGATSHRDTIPCRSSSKGKADRSLRPCRRKPAAIRVCIRPVSYRLLPIRTTSPPLIPVASKIFCASFT